MQPPSITTLLMTIVASLSSTTSAWQITAHTGSQCTSQTYRIFDGPQESSNRCININDNNPKDINCEQFTNGGWNKGPCSTNPGWISTVWVRYGTCRIYNAKNCDGTPARDVGDRQCANLSDGPQLAVIQSFKCWE